VERDISSAPQGARIDRQRTRTAVGLLRAGAALAFGLLSWTAAHELAAWLLDCAHATGARTWPWGHHASSAAVVLGCLGAGALLALLSAPGPRERADRRTPFAAVRFSALTITAGFVGADTAGRAIAGDYTSPSLLVLLIGLGAHLLVGAAASALWHCWASTLPWTLGAPREVRRPGAPCRTAMAARWDRPRPRHWIAAAAGRAPPCTAV
jgi:hypothetical protein